MKRKFALPAPSIFHEYILSNLIENSWPSELEVECPRDGSWSGDLMAPPTQQFGDRTANGGAQQKASFHEIKEARISYLNICWRVWMNVSLQYVAPFQAKQDQTMQDQTLQLFIE